MAIQSFYNAFFSVNGVDLSNHVESVKLDVKVDILEKTAMSNTEHQFLGGLTDWSLEVTMFQDYAAGSVDATLWALVGVPPVAFILRPDAGVKAPANPEYTGTVILESYEPISGNVSTIQKVNGKFRAGSALGRATA